MKRIVKWLAITVGVLLVLGFLLFLYFIPPFSVASPETFSKPEQEAAVKVDSLSDTAERLIAQRGRYLVVTIGCTACHTAAGKDGAPNYSRYLAGGIRETDRNLGTVYSANLTPDDETGLGRYSPRYIMHLLRTGQKNDGSIIVPRAMPWPAVSNLTDEDLYAVAMYLRHLHPVVSRIPAPSSLSDVHDPEAQEAIDPADYSISTKE